MEITREDTRESNPTLYLSDAEDTEPLLWEINTYRTNRTRGTETNASSIVSALRRGRSNTMTSIRSGYYAVKEHVDKEKFVYLIFISVFIYTVFMAAFYPRTSLAADFRLLHGNQLTEYETYRIYLDALSGKDYAKKHVRQYSLHSAKPGDASVLEYTVRELEKLDFSPTQLKYYAWFNNPLDTQVKLIHNGYLEYEASLMEDFLTEKSKFAHRGEFLKGYHDYSKNGRVVSQFVYVNYGTLDDYNLLLENGIDIDNKIHIVRSGKIYRGLKIKNAQLFGASGVITFTDPYDDGEITVGNGYDSYPYGPARQYSSIERGSVSYLTDIPGDPTSNGFATEDPDDEHIDPKDKIPQIPSIPMSAKEVAPILNKLNKRGIKYLEGGNIDSFDYSSGPSEREFKVEIVNNQQYNISEITNVVVDIPGVFSEGTIIIGSHRDHPSIGGAGRASSSSAIFLEFARGLKNLRDKGWVPLRPLKLVSWDGSENGILGSTEYAESFGPVLSKNSLAYIDLDKVVTGSKFKCVANPLLQNVLQFATKSTLFKDDDEWTVFDEWEKSSNNTSGTPGGGSDTMTFQNYLGIPSMSFGFEDDRTEDAVFPLNSHYDTQEWLEEFVDPDYKLHNTMAKLLGMAVLALSEKEMIPFKTSSYLKEIETWFAVWKTEIQEEFFTDSELETSLNKTYYQIKDLTENVGLNFDKTNTNLYKQTIKEMPLWRAYRKLGIYSKLLRANTKLLSFDKLFLSSHGLKDRVTMRHTIYAPNKYSGFDSDVLPGLHEAILERNRDDILHNLIILQIQLTNLKYLLL